MAEVGGVREAYCYLVSRIGHPVTEPQLIDLKLRLEDPAAFVVLRPRVEHVVRGELAGVTTLWRGLLEGPQHVW